MGENEDFIALDDRIQSMRNCDNSALRELLLDQILDLLLSHYIDIGSGFIKHNNAILAQDSTADADELAFTGAQICSAFADLEVDASTLLLSLSSLLLLAIELVSRL